MLLGFGLVSWQTKQVNADRVRQNMVTAIQQSSLQSEDMSMRLNNADLKTLRVRSLREFMDNYFKLYNTNSTNKTDADVAKAVNTSFNFYVANSHDLKAVSDDAREKPAILIVKAGKITSLTYFKTGTSKTTITAADEIAKVVTLDQPVDIKMVKVRSLLKSVAYEATTAVSIKRSPVASPVSNKLEDITVPFNTKGSSDLLINNVNIRDSLGNKIDMSNVTITIEDTSGKPVDLNTNLVNPEYRAVYKATDTVSKSKLTVLRVVKVDQNMPLIDTPDVYTDYVGSGELAGVQAYEMPNGATGTRGANITSKIKQNLSETDLLKAGTYTQELQVASSINGQITKKTRKLILLPNTPVITTTNQSIGTYRVGIMPNLAELLSGVVATSPRDGDITTAIVVNVEAVNAKTAGTYNVTYSVTAPTGHVSTTITRTITFK